jgi:hypothetical protein
MPSAERRLNVKGSGKRFRSDGRFTANPKPMACPASTSQVGGLAGAKVGDRVKRMVYTQEQKAADASCHQMIVGILNLIPQRKLTIESLEQLNGLLDMTMAEFPDSAASSVINVVRPELEQWRSVLLANQLDDVPDYLRSLYTLYAPATESAIEIRKEAPAVRIPFREFEQAVMELMNQLKDTKGRRE